MDYQKIIDAVQARWPMRTVRFYRTKDAITGKEGDLEWMIGAVPPGGFFVGWDPAHIHSEINGFVKGWLDCFHHCTPP
jgi:hypothetical protein